MNRWRPARIYYESKWTYHKELLRRRRKSKSIMKEAVSKGAYREWPPNSGRYVRVYRSSARN